MALLESPLVRGALPANLARQVRVCEGFGDMLMQRPARVRSPLSVFSSSNSQVGFWKQVQVGYQTPTMVRHQALMSSNARGTRIRSRVLRRRREIRPARRRCRFFEDKDARLEAGGRCVGMIQALAQLVAVRNNTMASRVRRRELLSPFNFAAFYLSHRRVSHLSRDGARRPAKGALRARRWLDPTLWETNPNPNQNPKNTDCCGPSVQAAHPGRASDPVFGHGHLGPDGRPQAARDLRLRESRAVPASCSCVFPTNHTSAERERERESRDGWIENTMVL